VLVKGDKLTDKQDSLTENY